MSTRATRIPAKFFAKTAQLKAETNKYRNKRVEVDGLKFDSQKEAARYFDLLRLEKAGKIVRLERQPRWKFAFEGRPVLIRSTGFPNGRQASFKADFRYWDNERSCEVVEDVKSLATRTQAYVLRKAMLECMHPHVRVEEV